MVEREEGSVKSKTEDVEFWPMSIIKDKKQFSIRIPSEVAEALDIDTEKDIFVFTFNKKELTLHGSLEDGEIWRRAIKDGE